MVARSKRRSRYIRDVELGVDQSLNYSLECPREKSTVCAWQSLIQGEQLNLGRAIVVGWEIRRCQETASFPAGTL
jgi:hypothetical protein